MFYSIFLFLLFIIKVNIELSLYILLSYKLSLEYELSIYSFSILNNLFYKYRYIYLTHILNLSQKIQKIICILNYSIQYLFLMKQMFHKISFFFINVVHSISVDFTFR